MTFPPAGTARRVCVAADEALTVAAFCTGDFAAAERLFGEAQAMAARAGERAGEAFAVGGLGWRFITATSPGSLTGCRWMMPTWPPKRT